MKWVTEHRTYTVDHYKTTLDDWINSTINDQGLYRDITEEIEDDEIGISAAIQGQKDTIYILAVDIHGSINYYIGHLESC